MPLPKCSEDEFIALFREAGTNGTAKKLGLAPSNVHQRRQGIQNRRNITIEHQKEWPEEYPARIPLSISNGTIVVGSDAHYWPGKASCAHKGFISLISQLRPSIVILNGDVFDGSSISRFPPIGWEKKPSLIEEKDACEERLMEIEDAAKNAQLIWTMGNHDARFENKLSSQAHEFKDMPGFSLKDHFPHWKHCISAWVNDNLVIKHRLKGGIHAAHNNTLWAGKSILTGHLHSLKVTPFDDYNGTRWGIDSGTLADPYGAPFRYTEDNPLNHRSGFIVLTIKDKKLLWPEIAAVVDKDHVQFRGNVFKVK